MSGKEEKRFQSPGTIFEVCKCLDLRDAPDTPQEAFRHFRTLLRNSSRRALRFSGYSTTSVPTNPGLALSLTAGTPAMPSMI